MATRVARSVVYVSVRVFGTAVSPAHPAKPIEVSFGLQTRMGPKKVKITRTRVPSVGFRS